MTELEKIKELVARHAKYEPECHEHYHFDDLSRLIEAVEVMDRALEKIEARDGDFPYAMDVKSEAREARAKVKQILRGEDETKEG